MEMVVKKSLLLYENPRFFKNLNKSLLPVSCPGFLEGVCNTSIELHKAGVWVHSPQPLNNWKYFNQNLPDYYVFHVKLLLP